MQGELRAELVRAMPSAAENIKKTSVGNERLCKASVELCVKCLQGTNALHEYERLPMNYFFLPTNFTNFRTSECRAELVRAMPSAAENVKKFTLISFND